MCDKIWNGNLKETAACATKFTCISDFNILYARNFLKN